MNDEFSLDDWGLSQKTEPMAPPVIITAKSSERIVIDLLDEEEDDDGVVPPPPLKKSRLQYDAVISIPDGDDEWDTDNLALF
jgi:hypothetical protein